MPTLCGCLCTLTTDNGHTNTVTTNCKVFGACPWTVGSHRDTHLVPKLSDSGKWLRSSRKGALDTQLLSKSPTYPWILHQQVPYKDKTLPQLASGARVSLERDSSRITEKMAAKPK